VPGNQCWLTADGMEDEDGHPPGIDPTDCDRCDGALDVMEAP
jgi:hypothetical protein